VARRMAVVAALGLMLLPGFAAQNDKPVVLNVLSTGKEHLRRDEFETARSDFARLISIDPHSSPVYNLLACTYLKMDSLAPATKNIARSQQVDSGPRNSCLVGWLGGIVLIRQGNVTEAESYLAKAAVGLPFVAGLRIARARHCTDSLFADGKDTEKSSEEYRSRLAELLLDEFIDYQLFGENGNRAN
jgi:tetratricopeptide (TPR) repeat protein